MAVTRRSGGRVRKKVVVAGAGEEPAVATAEDNGQQSQQTEGSPAVSTSVVETSGISKAAAVRNALAAGHSENQSIIAFVLENYGLQLDGKMVSMYRLLERKREAKRAGSPGVVTNTSTRNPAGRRPHLSSAALASDVSEALKVVIAAAKQVGGIERLRDIAENLSELQF